MDELIARPLHMENSFATNREVIHDYLAELPVWISVVYQAFKSAYKTTLHWAHGIKNKYTIRTQRKKSHVTTKLGSGTSQSEFLLP